MIKSRSILNTRRKRAKIPKVAERTQYRRRRIRHPLTLFIDTVLLHKRLIHPRRHEPGGQATAQPVKLKRVLAATRNGGCIGQIIRPHGQRRGDMIVKATGLVEADDQQGLVPLGTVPDRIVHILEQFLARRNEARGVHRVSSHAAAGRVDEGEFRHVSPGGVLIELVHRFDVF